MPLNFPTPNLGDSTTLTHTVAGITWTWNSTKNVWSSDISPAADGAEVGSLQTVTDNGAVTTNVCEFQGLTTHEGGVNSTRFLALPTANNFNYYSNTGSSSIHSRLNLDGSKTAITGASNKTYHTFISQPALRQSSTIANFYGFSSQLNVPTADADFTGETVGFKAGDSLGIKTKGSCYGFKSDIDADGDRTYNFYAEGNAPNYFAGDTYIGGTTETTTLGLWKSTLSEEQKEQLEAGTLVAPANVSTPGDGSFARQWWYDQQSAEDQALIDSGELDYPSHFQAANFTDTFVLGRNTKINLRANGSIHAARINLPYRAEFMQVSKPDQSVFNQGCFVSGVGSGVGFKSVNSPSEAQGLNSNCPRLIFNRCQDPNGLTVDDNNFVLRANTQPCEDNSTLGEFNFATSQGTQDIYLCRLTAYKRSTGGELELSLHNSTTDSDHTYYFDPAGAFGYRDDDGNVFNLSSNLDRALLSTSRDALIFSSADHAYRFNIDFGSDLSVEGSKTRVGFFTGAAADPGVYGIHHSGNITVSLKNNSGEIRLTANGTGSFISGGSTVYVVPGSDNPDPAAGSINAIASSASEVKLNTFSDNNNRPIACFSSRVDTEDPLTSTTAGLAITTNRNIAPTVNGTDGKFTATYIHATGTAPNYFAGNVGIGTDSPSYKLDVRGGDIFIGQTTGNATNIRNYIKFGRTGGPKAGIGFINTSGNGRGSLIFMNDNANSGDEFTDSGERMRITPTGSVGIGTDNPQAKLDVDGLIQSRWGVKVTGGDVATIGKGLVSDAQNLYIKSDRAIDVNSIILAAQHSGNVGSGLNVSTTLDFSSTLINANLIGVETLELLNATAADTLSVFSSKTSATNTPSSKVGTCASFVAAADTTYGRNLNIGFRSSLFSDGNKNYNIYAEGSAPNYFNGRVFVSTSPSTAPGAEITSNGSSFATNSNTAGTPTLNIRRSNSSGGNAANTQSRILTFSSVAGTPIATIRFDGSGGVTNVVGVSDYRLKENIVDMTSAVNAVKALRPVEFNFTSSPGKPTKGFIAHEVQAVEPLAVFGTKDETEAIGTLADYDGTVLETEVAEPDELEYTEEVETDGVATMVTRTRSWTPSGTRPVYQGVDQTKLIPLLTKALQETMEKLEAAEARLDAAGL